MALGILKEDPHIPHVLLLNGTVGSRDSTVVLENQTSKKMENGNWAGIIGGLWDKSSNFGPSFHVQ